MERANAKEKVEQEKKGEEEKKCTLEIQKKREKKENAGNKISKNHK